MIFYKLCYFLVAAHLLLLTANAETNAVGGIQHRKLVATAVVDLGTAGNYAILAKTGISTVPQSAITGDIAVSPIAEAAMTGFSLTPTDDGTASTSTQLDGKAYAFDNSAPTPALLTTAVSDMETAYTDAAGRTNSNAENINIGSGEIGSLTLTSDGVNDSLYTFGSDVTINEDVTFKDSCGGDKSVFIIQISGNLIMASNVNVILANGAQAKNVFWQVAGNVKVGAGAHLEGILLVKTNVVFETGSSLNGRILAQTACDLQMATITEPSITTIAA